MFERFTTDARTTVIHAQEHARRLGHRYIGTEHLLLALAHSGQPAGEVLREHGVTPQRVEQELVQRAGLGAGAGLFADLDQEALAAIGIDLDAVRARIEAAFGTGALTRASQTVQGARRPAGRWLRMRRRRRARRLIPAATPPAPGGLYQAGNRATGHIPFTPAPGGLYQAGNRATGHIPFTPGAKKTLENTVREALAGHAGHIGTEHIALGLLSVNNGLVPAILAAVGTSGQSLRAAILSRYRKAS